MFDLDLKFDIDGNPNKKTKQAIEELGQDYKAFHLTFASEVLKKEISEGFPRDSIPRVDGRTGADILSLKPFGKIEFINTTVDIGILIMQSFDEIIARSPIGGSKSYFPNVKYAKWNWILHNDKVVAKSRVEARRFADNIGTFVRDGDRITFINVVPYARKLERYGITRSTRGKTIGQNLNKGRRVKKSKSRRGFVEIPRGTYAGSQRVIKSLFTGKARVSQVKYIPFNISVEGMRSHFVATGKGANQKPGRPYLYHVIDVIISSSGFTGVVQ